MSDEPISQSKLVIPNKFEHISRVRDLIGRAAKQAGFSPQEVQRIATAAFEAVINAATHGSPLGVKNTISIDVRVYADKFIVEVADQGPGFGDFKPSKMPDVTSNRGRGVPLMWALMDDVKITSNDGARVTLTKYLEKSE